MEERNLKGQFKKGQIPWNKNKHFFKSKIKLDLFFIKKEYLSGKSATLIAKELNVSVFTILNRLEVMNIRKRTREDYPSFKDNQFKKGYTPWDKGKQSPTNGCFKKECIPWNKDKIGVQVSNKKGKTYEELYGEENSNNYKEIIKNKRQEQVFPVKDTSIENKIKELLQELNIRFEQHKYLSEIKHCYQCDFFIPKQDKIEKNIVLETDGCYWHGCSLCNKELTSKQKVQIAKDNKRTKELKGKGYKILRLWEHEIKDIKIENLKEVLL